MDIQQMAFADHSFDIVFAAFEDEGASLNLNGQLGLGIRLDRYSTSTVINKFDCSGHFFRNHIDPFGHKVGRAIGTGRRRHLDKRVGPTSR